MASWFDQLRQTARGMTPMPQASASAGTFPGVGRGPRGAVGQMGGGVSMGVPRAGTVNRGVPGMGNGSGGGGVWNPGTPQLMPDTWQPPVNGSGGGGVWNPGQPQMMPDTWQAPIQGSAGRGVVNPSMPQLMPDTWQPTGTTLNDLAKWSLLTKKGGV